MHDGRDVISGISSFSTLSGKKTYSDSRTDPGTTVHHGDPQQSDQRHNARGHTANGGPAPDPSRAISDDVFDENRAGLDHLNFSVASLEELEAALRLFDEHQVPHGYITDLGPDLGLYVLALRDPDNIQLELTALYG